MREPYVPLFCSITQSTVWSEDAETCKVFITMMALSDPEGFVAASSPGIAAVARLPLETVDRALERLMAPDPRSRNKANGGRRVVEVERGWHLPAIPWFRALARKEAERARKREWARANNSGRPTGASANARRTETETETETQTCAPQKVRAPERARERAAPITGGGVAKVYSLPNTAPPQDYLDEAAMRAISREQAISTWEHYRGEGLPRHGVERVNDWLCKRAKERANQLARVERAKPRAKGDFPPGLTLAEKKRWALEQASKDPE